MKKFGGIFVLSLWLLSEVGVSSVFAEMQFPSSIPCYECLPVESLPIPLQKKVDTILTQSLDGLGLYSWVGNFKPYSMVFNDRPGEQFTQDTERFQRRTQNHLS